MLKGILIILLSIFAVIATISIARRKVKGKAMIALGAWLLGICVVCWAIFYCGILIGSIMAIIIGSAFFTVYTALYFVFLQVLQGVKISNITVFSCNRRTVFLTGLALSMIGLITCMSPEFAGVIKPYGIFPILREIFSTHSKVNACLSLLMIIGFIIHGAGVIIAVVPMAIMACTMVFQIVLDDC